jgi:hypothetical protein
LSRDSGVNRRQAQGGGLDTNGQRLGLQQADRASRRREKPRPPIRDRQILTDGKTS